MQGREEDNRPKPSSNRQWTTELNSTYKYIKISLPNTLLNILLWSLNESSYISLTTTRQGSEEWTGARTNQRNITKINYDDLKLKKFDWIFHLLWVHCSIVHCCLCFVLPFHLTWSNWLMLPCVCWILTSCFIYPAMDLVVDMVKGPIILNNRMNRMTEHNFTVYEL